MSQSSKTHAIFSISSSLFTLCLRLIKGPNYLYNWLMVGAVSHTTRLASKGFFCPSKELLFFAWSIPGVSTIICRALIPGNFLVSSLLPYIILRFKGGPLIFRQVQVYLFCIARLCLPAAYCGSNVRIATRPVLVHVKFHDGGSWLKCWRLHAPSIHLEVVDTIFGRGSSLSTPSWQAPTSWLSWHITLIFSFNFHLFLGLIACNHVFGG